MNKYISRKNVYLLLLLINIILAVFRFGLNVDQPFVFHLYMLLTNFVGMIVGWEILLMVHNYLNKVFPKSIRFVSRIVAQIVLVTLLFTYLSRAIHLLAIEIFDYKLSFTWMIVYMMNFLMAIILNLVLFVSKFFYKWKSDLIFRTNLEKERAEVKYDALRNQLNPHFLFNALTSLNSLIFENQKLASDFLQQLSKVYRYTLQHRDKATVSLRTELNFVKNYISLLKTRFGEALEIKVEVDENDLDKGIAPVVSQMLLENAVKHNMVCRDRPLSISITSKDEYFIVENNIIRKTQVETSNKIGMENIKDLYKYLTDRPIEIEELENRYIVKIPLIH